MAKSKANRKVKVKSGSMSILNKVEDGRSRIGWRDRKDADLGLDVGQMDSSF